MIQMMETLPATTQTPPISTFLSQPKTHHAYGCRIHHKLRWQKCRGLAIKCGGGDWPTRPESHRKDEMNGEESRDEEESKEDINEKVELMEMEAIMGKDDGREPMDYKRRAGIFYKSSEMFQANKDNHPHPHHCT
ncbi:uncharacterized protein LOC112510248 [Cynara cardunculus var. scolymus]|uniref:uncharacterized protein LOC112510248 n=1 Tax=Cynara cardunculus var. scolymus TaxID=59895 RepID=UPI000D62F77E|nr:uncharacterized protein LOC112510248 [Cynara cardunculus var. scolymus]